MHLIRAEHALAGGTGTGVTTFADHINDLRDIDSYPTDYTPAGDEVAILQHHRRVNTLLQGLRLNDMYRWGIEPETANGTDPAAVWAPTAPSRNGALLPITIIEVRANCYLNANDCPAG
jgi:hypothetical protein